MPLRTAVTVSITPEHAHVGALVRSGRDSSTSEINRAGLRLLERVEADRPAVPSHRTQSSTGSAA